jgi:arginine decarboxylase
MMSQHAESGLPRLEINVAGGEGTGPTKLAAFDAALRNVGVANYNLLRLSSVIPPHSELTVVPRLTPPGQWGDRLYVVAAEWRTEEPGTEAWAGIGWIQDPELGRGLFVEHEGGSEAQLKSDIESTLGAMREGRGAAGDRLGEVEMVTHGVLCTDEPVCALVVAVFASESWHDIVG